MTRLGEEPLEGVIRPRLGAVRTGCGEQAQEEAARGAMRVAWTKEGKQRM